MTLLRAVLILAMIPTAAAGSHEGPPPLASFDVAQGGWIAARVHVPAGGRVGASTVFTGDRGNVFGSGLWILGDDGWVGGGLFTVVVTGEPEVRVTRLGRGVERAPRARVWTGGAELDHSYTLTDRPGDYLVVAAVATDARRLSGHVNILGDAGTEISSLTTGTDTFTHRTSDFHARRGARVGSVVKVESSSRSTLGKTIDASLFGYLAANARWVSARGPAGEQRGPDEVVITAAPAGDYAFEVAARTGVNLETVLWGAVVSQP